MNGSDGIPEETYRIKDTNDLCYSCAAKSDCGCTGIPRSTVFKYLDKDTLFAFVGDGYECYSTCEVEREE